MPRPKVLKNAKVVPIVFEAELYEKLAAAARSRGLSVSALIRMLVARELGALQRSEAAALEAQPAADPPDPLLELEAEELSARLSQLEEGISRLEESAKRVAALGYGLRPSLAPHAEELARTAWRLLDRWHELKGWFFRLKGDLPRDKAGDLSRRLAQAKRRLNEILKLLRVEEYPRRWR
jgi:hypothetical protein